MSVLQMDHLFSFRASAGTCMRIHLSRLSSPILLYPGRSCWTFLWRHLRYNALYGSMQCKLQGHLLSSTDYLLGHIGLLSLNDRSDHLL